MPGSAKQKKGRSTKASDTQVTDALVETMQKSLQYRFIYSMTGLVLGLVCMLGGIVLFLHGIAGHTSWTAKILGNESTITDAAPGAVLFIVGLFVVIVTRYKVRLDRELDRVHDLDKIRFIGLTRQ